MATNKQLFKTFFFISFLLIMIGGGTLAWQKRKQIYRWAKQKHRELVQKSTPSQQACSCTNQILNLKSVNYKTVHIPKLKNNKYLTFIADDKTKKKLLNQGKLIQIQEKGFKIKSLKHSSRHLTPQAKDVLEELSQRFQQQMKETKDENSYIRISSLTRTHEQQKQLSAVNNAATKDVSAHSFGQAFDIDFVISKDCTKATKTLETLLNQMYKEGKLLLCPEKGCIHVTIP
jgi:hypothetical protein